MAIGINIASNSKGLGGALTNPTVLSKSKGSVVSDYPVLYKGVVYADAESAYKAFADKCSNDQKPLLMLDVIVCKFDQHPRLVEEITRRGGCQFLAKCSHYVSSKPKYWEGKGLHSPFINVLYDAYVEIIVNKERV